MNLAMRILGVAVFVAVFAGAAYAAFEVIDTDPAFRKVEMTTPTGAVTLPVTGEGPISVTLTNQGNQPVNVTLSISDDRFSFTPAQQGVSLAPDERKQLRGVLTATGTLDGTARLTAQALDADRGNVLASGTIRVQVRQEVSLTVVEPGALSGGNLTVRADVVNVLDAPQQFNFSIEDGTVNPASITIRANQTRTVDARVTVPATTEDTYTVRFQAINATGRVLSQTAEVPVVQQGDVLVDPIIESFVVAPGNAFTVPVQVLSNLGQAADVQVEADGLVETSFDSIRSGGATGGFITLQLAGDASGTIEPTITIAIGDVERSFTIEVDTSPEGEPVQPGSQVSVDLIGRLRGGQVAQASMAGVGEGPFERAGNFQSTPNFDPIRLVADPQAENSPLPAGFMAALVGMHPDETRTIVLTPEQAYGGARVNETLPATETLEREQVLTREIPEFPIQQLPPVFDIENRTEGDVVSVGSADTGGPFKFELTRIGDSSVDLLRADEVGDELTLYSPWPNATEVQDRNATHVTYYTTPPEDLGAFTWDRNPQGHQAAWTNATTVASLNQTHIVLRFDPDVGLEYTAITGQTGPQQYRVEEVDDTSVRVSTSNPNPLGGQTLIYDIFLRENLGPAQTGGPQVGGGPPTGG